ncbi:uncharacterized protein LOC110888086 [Helianthus annuus]|uniref:uncharacterized protein LOC110888086 n=1 Tax=Helianthus annuus TaxID=4232 RepID=UPI000B9008FA|nr:uncharacterized protein LOC110888086 [Helianthus annuus]
MKFPKLWRKWVGVCLKSSWASVLVNGSPTSEFKLQRGLRQGDPLSHFLFILAMEAQDVIMTRAGKRGAFKGIKVPNKGPCISHLHYAEDVIFMREWSETNILNLNRILRCFYLCSGLKVDLNKSSLYGVGVEEEEIERMARKLKCKKGNMSFGFLGLAIGANMKRVKFWKPVAEKFNTKLPARKAKCLSFTERFVLAKAVMGALPNYYFSIYLAPKKVIKSLDAIHRDFIWGRKDGKNKIHWIAWNKVVRSKKYGGFGTGRLRSTWKDIVVARKELDNMGINLKERLAAKVGDGRKVKFWLDNWAGGLLFMDRYPELFRIAKSKQDNVPECAIRLDDKTLWNIGWTRPPNNEVERAKWTGMLNVLCYVRFTTGTYRWG